MKKLRKSECGQAMVEFALTAVMFLMLVFAVLDMGWIGYQMIAFDYGYQKISWDFQFNWTTGSAIRKRGESGLSDDELIKRRIVSSIDLINEKDLTVSGGRFDITTEKVSYDILTGNSVAALNSTKRNVNIRADIKYRIRPLTPMGLFFFKQAGKDKEGIVVEKKLNKLRFIAERTDHGK